MYNMFNMLSQTVGAQAAEGTAEGLHFTTENLGEAFLCSGAGMVGIFLVVGIIIFSVSLLNKAGSRPVKKDK